MQLNESNTLDRCVLPMQNDNQKYIYHPYLAVEELKSARVKKIGTYGANKYETCFL